MWELAYSIFKDLGSFIISLFNKRKRNLSYSDIVRLRQKWKSEFEHKILEARVTGAGRDVIIRDVKRMDSYPDGANKTWYKAGLVSTYHRGIQVRLGIGKLTKDPKSRKWRYTNYQVGESGEFKVSLIGFIPFENIEAVDWDGDEYNYKPHIYCHFTEKSGVPYERIVFCEENHLDDSPFYTEISDYESVHKFSKKFDIDYFA